MRKTIFAGLTVLNPDESVTTDNGAFIGRDRDVSDRLLEIGAKTHRHNALPGLEDPASVVGASAISSGGTIGAGQTFSLGYTLEDLAGGETLLSPPITVSTSAPMNPPFSAPAGEVEYDDGGDLLVDTYYYAYSFMDAGGGETPIGPAKAVEREPGFAEAKINLSGMAGPVSSAGASGWRMYRATGGGDFGYLSSGIGDTFVDDGSLQANCDITPLPDQVNTTNGDSSLDVILPSADAIVAEGEFINVYLTNGSDFVGDALLEQFPVSSAGQSKLYRSLSLLTGQPPDVNSSIGGASLIDPDTEILDWHWKRPVDSPDELAEGVEGDVRLSLSNRKLYGVFGSSATGPEDWDTVFGTSGIGSSGVVVQNGVIVDPAEIIEFVSSGTVDVNVSEPLTGKASVLITGNPSYPDVTSSGVTVEDASAIEFLSSGGVQVTETEPRAGEALVLIEGDRALLGQEGMGVITGGVASTPRPNKFKQYTWVQSEEPTNMADNDIWVDNVVPDRVWSSASVNLSSGSSGVASFSGGAGIRLLKISTNKRARVRVYGDEAARTADRDREIGIDPVGDHGVQLDYANTMTSSGGIRRITPIVDAANLDDPAVDDLYLAVTNYDADGDVIIAFLYVPTEVT